MDRNLRILDVSEYQTSSFSKCSQIERRKRDAQQPVRNLASPGQEINQQPVLCLFMEDVEPLEKKRLAAELVEFSETVNREINEQSAQNAIGIPQDHAKFICYCSVAIAGAVPQIRMLCHIDKPLNDEQQLLMEKISTYL